MALVCRLLVVKEAGAYNFLSLSNEKFTQCLPCIGQLSVITLICKRINFLFIIFSLTNVIIKKKILLGIIQSLTHSIPGADISVPAIMAFADQVRVYPYAASHYIAIVLIRSKSMCADNC